MRTPEQSREVSDLSLSSSEKRTLQHLAQGELHVSELDWLAVQRLKKLRLAEDRGRVTVITEEGRRAMRRQISEH
jgi:hypothetical protein